MHLPERSVDGGALHVATRDRFLALGPSAMADFVRRDGRVAATRLERARIFFMLGRPRTCVAGLLTYALGFSYTGAAISTRTVLGAFLALCIGFSANLHNTATDLDEDSKNLPGRVLSLARLGHRPLLALSGFLGAAMFVGGLALGMHFAIFMTLALLGLHQYSAPPVRSKGRPILGLWVFAQAVVFPFLFGWCTEPGDMLGTLFRTLYADALGGPHPPAAESLQSFRYLGMWAFLTVWFMAKGLVKNVPDFAGDRAAGVRTSATLCASQRSAAIVAGWVTVAAYSSLGVLVALGLEAPRILFSLVWIVPVALNAARLSRAVDGSDANRILRADMLLSTGFAATLLLLVAPGRENLAVVIVSGLVLLGSDLTELDSRRAVDSSPHHPRPER